jgi:hypothetical protein
MEIKMPNRLSGYSVLLVILLSSPLAAYVKTTYMVAMRDGVPLATDVYLSDNPGKWPALLVRTPYGKNTEPLLAALAIYLTGQGYAVVIQDTRGRFDSKGADSLFLDDGWGEQRQDGYDTVEWIAAQNWSNGKVGTWGASAFGITQYLMAGSAPPHLVCQFVEVAATNLYSQAAYPGGVLLKNLVEEWITGQGSEYLIPFVIANPNYNSIWERLNLESRFHVVNVPIHHLGGWHDIFVAGTINGFVGLQHHGAVGARGKQKLTIGPWTHANWFDTKQGELTFPSNSAFTINNYLTEMLLRWFDYWLQGKDTKITSEPPVRYYVMGAVNEAGAPGNEWRNAADWPPAAQPTPFYFHQSGDLNTEKSATTQAFASYQYDPKNPVPTKGGRNLTIDAGPYDQRSTESRPDVLIFTTPVLAQPMEVIGKITAKLWVSSSAKDTDFMAKLMDVYPDGRSMLVCDGALRARHRYSLRQENFMAPDSIYQCEIDLWSTAIIFNQGHRLRVAISSSNAPRFDPNPNTGRPLRADSVTVVATNTIHLDANYPSHIVLPVTNGTTSVSLAEQGETAPRNFVLGQNYPNPTFGETQISYSLPRTVAIRITLFNMLGQEIKTLVDGLAPGGIHEVKWDGRDRNGQRVAQGVYFYRLETGKIVTTKKLIVLQ